FDDSGIKLTDPNSGLYTWDVAIPNRGTLPSTIANLPTTLTFTICWDGSDSCSKSSPIAIVHQPMFVTLGVPLEFKGGSIPSIPAVYDPSHVTLARLQYVTTQFAGKGGSDIVDAVKLFLFHSFGGGGGPVSDAWTTLLTGNPPITDCSSLAWMAAVLLENSGVPSGFGFAFATNTTADAAATYWVKGAQ